MSNPLEALAKLRRSLCEDARRALVACIAAEGAASATLRSAEVAIIHEQEAATALDTADGAVEAFAAWLPAGRRAVAQASEAHARSVAATVQARAVLAAARAAAEAADRLLTIRAEARAHDAARHTQATLDETALQLARRRQ